MGDTSSLNLNDFNLLFFLLITVFYYFKSEIILKKIEKFANSLRNKNQIANLIFVFISFASLKIIHYLILFILFILIMYFSIASIFNL